MMVKCYMGLPLKQPLPPVVAFSYQPILLVPTSVNNTILNI